MADPKSEKKKWSIPLSIKTVGLIVSLIFFVGFILFFIFQSEEKDFYQNLAVFIIVSWMAILILYYSWAIGFYNVNFGWTNEDWKRMEELKKVDPTAVNREPKGNPHHDETLGLPGGTIRGTIAVSLLVGGLAMMIASLSFRDSLRPNEYFIDNFEFFKTAYLMMIAFYFGNKSLEFLKDRKQILKGGDGGPAPSSAPAAAGVQQSVATGQASQAKNLMTAAPPGTVAAMEEPMPVIDSPPDSKKDFEDPNSIG